MVKTFTLHKDGWDCNLHFHRLYFPLAAVNISRTHTHALPQHICGATHARTPLVQFPLYLNLIMVVHLPDGTVGLFHDPDGEMGVGRSRILHCLDH